MPVNSGKFRELRTGLGEKVQLVAVSKTKPVEDVRELYGLGQRDFGENYVQELVDKQPQLPGDVRWHFIGHLQSNKVKYIAPFVHLIQGVDSYKLLKEIDKQAQKNQRVIDCLLQVHIAQEETKFGFDDEELDTLIPDSRIRKETSEAGTEKTTDATANESGGTSEALNALKNVRVVGLMGMASFSDDQAQVRKEFHYLKTLFDKYARRHTLRILSMGMSGDYPIAIEEGSTMIRVGSLIFGARNYPRP